MKAREGSQPSKKDGKRWASPPGFAQAAMAEIDFVKDRERVRLRDAAGAVLAEFFYETHAEGRALRVGKGKFVVDAAARDPRVRYWHPDREFKWRDDKWQFKSHIAEAPIESTSSGTSFTSDSSRSSFSSGSSGAAAPAALMAAGGTFDGGGASQAWDSSGSLDAGASSETATAY